MMIVDFMEHAPVIYSFLGFLSLFLLVGLLSFTKREKSTNDYLLASREMSPMFAGLSAAASTASGFGFIGIIGFGYAMGLAGAWFVFGCLAGSFIAFAVTSRRFRVYSQRYKCVSYTEFLSCNVTKKTYLFGLLLGVLGIAAMTVYATAQFTSGSKALHVLFGWDYKIGAILAAIIVLLYCWAGGIRASIWTDVAQIIVMYAAMSILMIAALAQIGGIAALMDKLAFIDPHLASWIPYDKKFGPLMFIIGCLGTGLSMIGFPHVMVRYMTLKNSKDARKAIYWFEGSYGAFYVTAYIVAMCTRVLVPDAASFDKELALPLLAMDLLPSVMVGVILAGIFAGTISTADSLILSSTASLSRDIIHKYKDSYLFMKISTLGLTLTALLISLYGNASVFDLVMFVIALMGAGFAPILLVQSLRLPLTQNTALIMAIGGVGAALSWRYAGLHVHFFDSLLGMIVAMAIYSIMRLISVSLLKSEEKPI